MRKIFIIYTFISLISFNNLNAQFTNVLIDNLTGAEEPSIAINPLNPDQIAAGANFQNSYFSIDGGATWITGFINSSLTEAGDPCLVADSSGNIFYFHLVNDLDKVVCQKSSDGGSSYSDGSFTWNNNSLLQDKEWAAIDPHTGNVFITWTQYDNGFSPGPQDSSRIYFAKSTDNGATFTNGVRINNEAGDCLYLDITDPHPFVGPGGEVYVTFMDSNGIRFNRSLDTGNTWLGVQPVIDSGGVNRYNHIPGVNRIRSMPYSACDRGNSPYRGNLYVSWSDQRNGINNSDVFFIKSSDGGNTWTSSMKVNSDNSNNHQYRNAMTVDQTNGYIYIVYYDRRNYSNNDSSDVYISKSTDGGNNWIDYKISNSGFYSDGNQFDGDYIDIAAHAGIIRPIWTRIDNLGSGIWTCLFNESLTGVAEQSIPEKKFNFTVNPNPADVVVVLSFSRNVENLEGAIHDASGRKVMSFLVNNQREKAIDTNVLSPGIYFIKVGSITRKLVIEK